MTQATVSRDCAFDGITCDGWEPFTEVECGCPCHSPSAPDLTTYRQVVEFHLGPPREIEPMPQRGSHGGNQDGDRA